MPESNPANSESFILKRLSKKSFRTAPFRRKSLERKYSSYLFYRAFLVIAILGVTILLLLFFLFMAAGEERFFLWLAIGGTLAFSIEIYGIYCKIYKPYTETTKMLDLFITGYTVEGLYNMRFSFSPEMEQAILKMKGFINTNEILKVSKRQAQFLALQNQINPHFLYNTLEGIRGEALGAGLHNVAEMTEALARFFRYTISNLDNFVLLEDELSNIENYFFIQQYRFGSRLQLVVEYDDPRNSAAILRYKLPKLTLQPIVENAIIHGIERKVDTGTVRIKMETTQTRLLITISDDGVGMDELRLQQLNEKLNNSSLDYIKPDSEQKGGIAVVNVNKRIQLLFGEEYGICIYSTQGVGTDVEITLPLLTSIQGQAILKG
jgi:two-component system sensor histidine kinase YesM